MNRARKKRCVRLFIWFFLRFKFYFIFFVSLLNVLYVIEKDCKQEMNGDTKRKQKQYASLIRKQNKQYFSNQTRAHQTHGKMLQEAKK